MTDKTKALLAAKEYKTQCQSVNNVSFELLDGEKKILYSRKDICYASLGEAIKQNNSSKYLIRKPPDDCLFSLSKEDRIKWIKLCVRHGLILSNQDAEEINETLITDLDDEMYSADRLYVDICSYRFMWENVGFVKSILILVESGFDFWPAFIWSHGNKLTNYNHSWLNFDGSPYCDMSWKNQKLNIALIVFQKKYLENKMNKKLKNYKSLCISALDRYSARDIMRVSKYMKPDLEVLVTNPDDLLSNDSQKKVEELCTRL